MKKVLKVFICLVMILLLSACGCSNTLPGNGENSPTEESTEILLNDVPAGSTTDLAVRAAVSEYLDAFIACDFDKIKANLHEEDAWLFNFESEDQMKFYNAIFPRLEYSFDYVSEHKGVYGVMTTITSPDMAHVYGTIITDYIDGKTESGVVEFNPTDAMLEMVTAPDAPLREESLYIYVEYINGEYIVRCTEWLANELTGGAPEVSDELSNTLNEAMGALSE